MLYGLAMENIGHYQKSADYEESIHMTAIATPVFTNVDPPVDPATGEPVDTRIGGTKVLFLNNSDGKQADAKFLEFSGAGAAQIQAAINSCEERMAILGARIISAEKKGVESAEAARIHRAGENSVLAAFARNMSEKLTLAVRLMAEWNGEPEEICEAWSYSLNTDYDQVRGNGAQLATVMQGVEGGQLPRVALYNAVKDAEFIPEDMTYDEFLAEIEKDAAMIGVVEKDLEDELEQAEDDGHDAAEADAADGEGQTGDD